MPFLELPDGKKLSYREEGDGPPLVLVHGSPGEGRSWARVASHLKDRFRVVCPDLPGAGRSDELPENVRIACPDGFGAWLLAPALGALRRANPDLTVEIITATAHLPLTVRDFDVAVTLEEPTENARVIKRHLSSFALRLYATKDYLSAGAPIHCVNDLKGHTLISYVDHLVDVASLRAIHDRLPTSVKIQSTNIFAIWQAAAAGAGIGLIPTFVAVSDPRLVPVLSELEFCGDYWLVQPREYAHLARAQAVVRVIERMISDRKDISHDAMELCPLKRKAKSAAD